ncbi:MipA/OmpV family protein [Psychrobacter sp. I-STPA6b]|uniref:MipA/OmpV family protein n=1 Tax=Psychrobacter sp. I-STPA6b TaxID=2585718 RepID=UPI001D0C71D5|nr:MipA/OmpV family protein [Psychrobacter sp. I-STPA6b]
MAETKPLTADPEAKLSVGINAVMTRSVYDTKDTQVHILPSLFYDNNRVYARGNQIGAYLTKDNNKRISAYAQLNGTPFNPDDAKGNLAQLDERKRSIVVGAEYLHTTPIGGFRIQAAHDVSGNSDGNMGRINYVAKYSRDNFTAYPSVGFEWYDKNYSNYYYGVSEQEAKRSGVDAYQAKQSFRPYVNLSARYEINEHFAGFANQSFTYLPDAQYDSPMVKNRTEAKTTIGLLYNF